MGGWGGEAGGVEGWGGVGGEAGGVEGWGGVGGVSILLFVLRGRLPLPDEISNGSQLPDDGIAR